MLIEAGPNRDATWPGTSTVTGLARFGIDGGSPRVDDRGKAGLPGLRLRDLCVLQDVFGTRGEPRALDEQRRSVSTDVHVDFEDAKQPSTPATAHVNPIYMGVKGPYPWRRPV